MARSMTSRLSAGHGRARRTDDRGFSLVESVTAFTIFMIVASAATWWLVKTVQLTGLTRDRVTAANLATQQLEKLRGESNAGQSLDSGAKSVVVHGGTFTVTTSLTPGSTATCATGSSRQVSISVTWPAATTPVRYDSVLAC